MRIGLKRKEIVIISLVLLILTASFPAFSQPLREGLSLKRKSHQAVGPITGEVVAIGPNRFDISTASGQTKSIIVTPKTRFVKSDSQQRGTQGVGRGTEAKYSDIEIGFSVIVIPLPFWEQVQRASKVVILSNGQGKPPISVQEPLTRPKKYRKVKGIFEYGRFGVNIRVGGAGQVDRNKQEQLFVESGNQWQVVGAYYQASVSRMQIVNNPGRNQTYSWRHLDRTVTNRAKYNIKTLLVLGPYNHQRRTRMPSDLESWKEFVKEIVKRYSNETRGGVKYFALNNEPSVPQYWNDTPENYAILLRATYEAAKEANPQVKIVLGSIPVEVVVNQPSRQDFFPKVLKYRYSDGTTAENYFDIVDVHIYDEPSTFKKYVDYVRSLMTKDKPMIMTETASSSDPEYGGIKKQAQDVVKRFVTAFSLGIEALTWQPFSDHKAM